MTIGVRGKLFLVSLVLLSGVGLVSGLYLESSLRDWLEARVEHELERHARVAADLMESVAHVDDIATVDSFADRLGASTGARVTIIRADGVVLGDSELAPSAVREVENHGDRPEVAQARSEGKGVSQRYSMTMRTKMLYVAVPYQRPGAPGGITRVSTLLSEVDATIARLRLLLAIAGALGLALAVVMSGLASHLMTRTLRRLIETTSAISRGERGTQLPATSSDELGGLAGSVRRLTEGLEDGVRKLREERDRLGTILESMSDAVLALDNQQRITLANPAARELLGHPEGLEGRALLETVRAPELAVLVRDADARAPDVEFDLGGPAPRRILARAAALSSGGRVVVMHDVTEIRRLERIRRDFVANVSHELRTPVSIIRANAETLLDGAIDDPAVARKFIEPLQRNAVRLGSLVADLLDLSRIEAGRYGLELASRALEPTVRACVESLRGAASSKQISVEVDVDAGIRIRADAKALEQVLLNLLENALKYTQSGGHVVVTARTEASAGSHHGTNSQGAHGSRAARVRVEVEDDGPGIAAAHRERIFERFYRVDPGRSNDMGGTGLGLAIVKHLVTSQGGELGMKAASPHGSVFWFTLPAG